MAKVLEKRCASTLLLGERRASSLLSGRQARCASELTRKVTRAGASAMRACGGGMTAAERKRARCVLTRAQMRAIEREGAGEGGTADEPICEKDGLRGAVRRAELGAAASARTLGAATADGDALTYEDSLDDSSYDAALKDKVSRAYRAYDKGARAAGRYAKRKVGGWRKPAPASAGASAGPAAKAEVRPGAAKRIRDGQVFSPYRASAMRNRAIQRKASARYAQAAKRAAKSASGTAAHIMAKLGAAAAPFALLLMVVFSVPLALTQCSRADDTPADGLPPWITVAMVEEAISCQEDYGHPAGCTLAQMIVESGGGEVPSALATRDHNLFGMKWASSFEGEPEVAGPASWATNEDYGSGLVTITDAFIRFTSDVDCIRFRSRVFLQASHYADNETIKRACAEHSSDLMAEGLKEAGWATSPVYVAALKSVMDTYGLRRYDAMTLEDYRSQSAGAGAEYASATEEQKRIVAAAKGTASPGLNWCAKWVSQVYANAGYPYMGGDACDMYWAHCKTADRSKLEVGMMVAVPSHPNGGTEGAIYGHIGIYIGDGLVMHNVGGIQTTTLEGWCATFGGTHEVRFGWPPGYRG